MTTKTTMIRWNVNGSETIGKKGNGNTENWPEKRGKREKKIWNGRSTDTQDTTIAEKWFIFVYFGYLVSINYGLVINHGIFRISLSPFYIHFGCGDSRKCSSFIWRLTVAHFIGVECVFDCSFDDDRSSKMRKSYHEYWKPEWMDRMRLARPSATDRIKVKRIRWHITW